MTKYGKIYNNNKKKVNYNIAVVYQTNISTKRNLMSPFQETEDYRKKLMTETNHHNHHTLDRRSE